MTGCGAGGALGVVLAGGAGRRFGGESGAKAAARLGGVTLAARAAATLGTVLGEVVVCARGDTGPLEVAVPVWREDDASPRHPLSGIAAALERSDGRSVLVLACDLPFVVPGSLQDVWEASAGGTRVAVLAGQPLAAVYPQSVSAALAAAAEGGAPVRATIAALGAVAVSVEDPARTLFNVNTREDLATAETMLADGV